MLLGHSRLHAARFAGFAVLYLSLTQSLELSEILTGVSSAIIATLAVGAFSSNSRLHFSFEMSWLKKTLTVPYCILRDSVLILWALTPWTRNIIGDGSFYEETPDELDSPGLRAFETLRISIAPNSYVVKVDSDTGRTLIHQLVGRAELRL